MANILDIFRTHLGDILLEKSCEETGLSKIEIKTAFLFSLPAVLSIHKSKCEAGNNNFKETSREFNNFVTYLESDDLLAKGEPILQTVFNKNQREKICSFSRLLNINEASMEKILIISAAVIFSILREITDKLSLKREDHCILLDTLSGINSKYDREFVAALVKNPGSPDLVHPTEEISLDPENSKNEGSILGGYTGGK